MLRKLILLALVLALAGIVTAEPTGTSISATQTVTNTTLPVNTKSVVVINDQSSANTVYVRLFGNLETPADATTSSIAIKVGESVSFTFNVGSAANAGRPGYYKTLSAICAAGQTATVRVILQ